MESVESRLNSSGIFSQDSPRCSSMVKVTDLLSRLGETPEIFTGRILFMSMFNDISCDRNDNKDECLKNADYVKRFAGRFGISYVYYQKWTCAKQMFDETDTGRCLGIDDLGRFVRHSVADGGLRIEVDEEGHS